MEIKINREISSYSESMFLGLSLRQFICSLCAIALSVTIYFLFKDILGREVSSWLCIAASAPFAFFGFVKYHGMTGEQFLIAFIRSEILEPSVFLHVPDNMYIEIFKSRSANLTKGGGIK